jgi:hypothetical protein
MVKEAKMNIELIKNLKISESIKEGMLTVKKHRRNLFSLDAENHHYRNRWGNAEEIFADVQHYNVYGILPIAGDYRRKIEYRIK